MYGPVIYGYTLKDFYVKVWPLYFQELVMHYLMCQNMQLSFSFPFLVENMPLSCKLRLVRFWKCLKKFPMIDAL